MTLRPCDAAGDVLPVRSTSALCAGSEAVGRLAAYRLRLLQGDWWENPAIGCPVLTLLRENRLAGDSADALTLTLSEYLAATPGVLSVTDASLRVSGHDAAFSCRLLTREGETALEVPLSL